MIVLEISWCNSITFTINKYLIVSPLQRESVAYTLCIWLLPLSHQSSASDLSILDHSLFIGTLCPLCPLFFGLTTIKVFMAPASIGMRSKCSKFHLMLTLFGLWLPDQTSIQSWEHIRNEIFQSNNQINRLLLAYCNFIQSKHWLISYANL